MLDNSVRGGVRLHLKKEKKQKSRIDDLGQGLNFYDGEKKEIKSNNSQ